MPAPESGKIGNSMTITRHEEDQRKCTNLDSASFGTGMIAGILADAITNSANARLAVMSSRRIENAPSFTAD
jgi:hypothetical protein